MMLMKQDWTPDKEIEFFTKRLAQEEAAARSDGPDAIVHAQLAQDYSAALTAFRNLTVNR
jgi:hypothetical protein